MNASFPNDDLRDAQLDENDPVWRLLAESPRPEPDGWFTARTLARCRHAQMESKRGLPVLRIWRWVIGGGLGICLAMFMTVGHLQPISSDKDKNLQEAFEIVASFNSDSDSSSSSSNSWTDSSL